MKIKKFICENCQSEVTDDQKYCGNCGAMFDMGDASAKSYKYTMKKKSDTPVEYLVRFKTGSGLSYSLGIREISRFLNIDFKIEGVENEYMETNRGEMFKVMATIVNATKEVFEKHENIKGIRFNPASKGNKVLEEGGDEGAGRERLYLAFIRKLFPEAKIVKGGAVSFAIIRE